MDETIKCRRQHEINKLPRDAQFPTAISFKNITDLPKMENCNWLAGKRKRCSEESSQNVDFKAKSIKVELLEEWEVKQDTRKTQNTLAYINLCNDEIISYDNDDVELVFPDCTTNVVAPAEEIIQPKPEAFEENAERVTGDFIGGSDESSLDWCKELQKNIYDLQEIDETILVDSPDFLPVDEFIHTKTEPIEENAAPVTEAYRDDSSVDSFQEIWENLFDSQETYEPTPMKRPSATLMYPVQAKIEPKTEPVQQKTEPQLKTEPIQPKLELVEPKTERVEVKQLSSDSIGVRSTLIECFREMRRSMFEPGWKTLRDYCKYIPDHIGLIRRRLVSAQAELERLKLDYDEIVDVDKERDRTVTKFVEFIKKDVYNALEPAEIIDELKTHIPMTKKMLTNVRRTKEYQRMIMHGQNSLIRAFKSYQIYGLALAQNVRKGREFQQNMAQFMYSLNRDAVIGLI